MSIGIEEKINFKKTYCTNRIKILSSALITVCYGTSYLENQKNAKKLILQLTVQEVKTKKTYCANLKYFLQGIYSIYYFFDRIIFWGVINFFIFLHSYSGTSPNIKNFRLKIKYPFYYSINLNSRRPFAWVMETKQMLTESLTKERLVTGDSTLSVCRRVS